MVYDFIEVLNNINGILVDNSQKCNLIPILDVVRKKIDGFSVEGFSRGFRICLPTEWFHTGIWICSAIVMSEDISVK